jgi:hypothetical protein
MAYDLLLRRQTSSNWARSDHHPKPLPVSRGSWAARIAVALAVVVLPQVGRSSYSRRLRREHSTDLRGRALRTTVEVPAVSMRGLVYGDED